MFLTEKNYVLLYYSSLTLKILFIIFNCYQLYYQLYLILILFNIIIFIINFITHFKINNFRYLIFI